MVLCHSLIMEQVFSEYFGFPCQALHPLINIHHYNWQFLSYCNFHNSVTSKTFWTWWSSRTILSVHSMTGNAICCLTTLHISHNRKIINKDWSSPWKKLLSRVQCCSGESEGNFDKNMIVGFRFELGTSHKRSRSSPCCTAKSGIVQVNSLSCTPWQCDSRLTMQCPVA
jgi:hypothetical protein